MTTVKTFVLDNGASLLKAGFSSEVKPLVMPNAIMKAKSERRRPFIGNQIDDCRDLSSLFYLLAFQKGYLVNWDVQKTVWDYLFGNECLNACISQCNLVITEPYFNFKSIQEGMTEMLFEEYDLSGLLRITCGDACSYDQQKTHPDRLCCLIVESGYSFTHVLPYIFGKLELGAVRRVEVGGKVLTNYAKDIISYRQLNVMDETCVVNQLKEDCCYVTQNWSEDMKLSALPASQNPIARDYLLPDFSSLRRGRMKSRELSTGRPVEGEQIVRLTNERFSIPELLFRPSDVGIQQMGVPEALMDAVEACEAAARPHLLNNIVLIGGSVKFPGFAERLQTEVRQMASYDLPVRVTCTDEPLTHAWHCAARLARDSQLLTSMLLTRAQWEEQGANAIVETEDD